MGKYFISATDFGSGEANRTHPRYRIYTWNTRRESWGHIGNHPVSSYFWTDTEALEVIKKLEAADAAAPDPWLIVALVTAAFVVLMIGRGLKLW